MKQQMEDRIRRSNLIPAGSTVVLGLSGGPDSITLLYALHAIREEMSLCIVPVHVNHQLRKNANREESHVRKVCESIGISCKVAQIDCNQIAEKAGISVEEAGRNERYRIFDEVCKNLESSGVPKERIVIAVAHNADDQCETVLQRIVRGTGIRGLAGIPFHRFSEAGYSIVRPLLCVPRSDIETYVALKELEPNEDESNQSLEYTRNRIRLELIPYLETNFNPGVKHALTSLSEIAAEEDSYMTDEARQALAEVRMNPPRGGGLLSDAILVDGMRQKTEKDSADVPSITVQTERNQQDACHCALRPGSDAVLSVPKLRSKHPAIARRLIAELMCELGAEAELRSVHVRSILKLAESEHPSGTLDLPCGLQAVRRYDHLVFRQREIKKTGPSKGMSEQMVRTKEDKERPRLRVSILEKLPEKCTSNYACFDYEAFRVEHGDLHNNICIRPRLPGDRIAINAGKHKKIQDYMVDAKIPKEIRDTILLAAIGNDVLWVLPSPFLPTKAEQNKGKFSQKYQICTTSKALLFLEIIELV